MRIRIFLLLGALAACSPDPYDALLGPRNPRPAAERYLSSRPDISDADKNALLGFRPCSIDVLKALSEVPAREIRSLVAANPSADESLLTKMSSDKESGVRQYVATNPSTPGRILARLANDTNETVRWQVANRKKQNL